MERREAPDSRDTFLDRAGLVILGVAALLCAVLALAGLAFAGQMLPFLVGALLGDALFYSAVKATSYKKPLVILSVLAAALGLVFSFNLWIALLSPGAPRIPWEIPIVVEKFALGLTLGFGGLILSTVVFPGVFSPQTWDEAVEQKRELTRVVFIVASVLLILLTAILLLFGFLALIARSAAYFVG